MKINTTIINTTKFLENGSFKDKSNKAIFLNELLYMLYYDRIDISEGMLIKQVNQKSVMFVTIAAF